MSFSWYQPLGINVGIESSLRYTLNLLNTRNESSASSSGQDVPREQETQNHKDKNILQNEAHFVFWNYNQINYFLLLNLVGFY